MRIRTRVKWPQTLAKMARTKSVVFSHEISLFSTRPIFSTMAYRIQFSDKLSKNTKMGQLLLQSIWIGTLLQNAYEPNKKNYSSQWPSRWSSLNILFTEFITFLSLTITGENQEGHWEAIKLSLSLSVSQHSRIGSIAIASSIRWTCLAFTKLHTSLSRSRLHCWIKFCLTFCPSFVSLRPFLPLFFTLCMHSYVTSRVFRFTWWYHLSQVLYINLYLLYTNTSHTHIFELLLPFRY